MKPRLDFVLAYQRKYVHGAQSRGLRPLKPCLRGAPRGLPFQWSAATLFAHRTRCLNLEWLISTKRAAGRPRDLEAIAELEALREEIG